MTDEQSAPEVTAATDGTDALCLALYGRKAGPKDWLGGSQAKMLHDAAARIDRLQTRITEQQATIERLREGLEKIVLSVPRGYVTSGIARDALADDHE